jgi:hypothetical protein
MEEMKVSNSPKSPAEIRIVEGRTWKYESGVEETVILQYSSDTIRVA